MRRMVRSVERALSFQESRRQQSHRFSPSSRVTGSLNNRRARRRPQAAPVHQTGSRFRQHPIPRRVHHQLPVDERGFDNLASDLSSPSRRPFVPSSPFSSCWPARRRSRHAKRAHSPVPESISPNPTFHRPCPLCALFTLHLPFTTAHRSTTSASHPFLSSFQSSDFMGAPPYLPAVFL